MAYMITNGRAYMIMNGSRLCDTPRVTHTQTHTQTTPHTLAYLYSDANNDILLKYTGLNMLIWLTMLAELSAPDFQCDPLMAARSRLEKSCLGTTSVTFER